jgi:DNA-binding NtrC family response regulator
LIVDDDESIREYVRELLVRRGHTPELALGGLNAVSKIRQREYDLIILDIRMPDMTGHEVLQKIKAQSPNAVVVMMTAFSSVPDAVKAIRNGAYDYLPKPFKERDFDLLLNRALELSSLIRENKRLKERISSPVELIGRSHEIMRIKELIESVADSKITVLVTGSSGTGKEVVARMLHAQSSRSDKPYIRINCAALPDTLLESELFGYEKGAFTGADKAKQGKFEAADGGTLLLDEISETSPAFQAKLLRVIQEREFSRIGSNNMTKVDVRLVATSNRDLQEMIKKGLFREDLYFRLNVLHIKIPDLRSRKDDIPLLADFFLQQYSQDAAKTIHGFTRDAMMLLRNYPYQGNVRELQNIILRAVVICSNELIDSRDLAMDSDTAAASAPSIDMSFIDQNLNLYEIEKRVILNYLRKFNGNRCQAARVLNVSVRTIRNKLIDYRKDGIEVSADGITSIIEENEDSDI